MRQRHALLVLVLLVANLHAADRPNIVILLADDLGFNDVSFRSEALGDKRGDIQTPHIDRIANEGVKLDNFYVCPMCSPTRAGLLTGRWPIRYGMMRAVIPPWRKYGLPTDERTIADMLANAGYESRGIVGKWHLGHSSMKYHPNRRGFTFFYGHYNGAIDYFDHTREGEIDWHHNSDTVKEEGYTTDLIARESVKFIRTHKGDKPFFLYVPFNAPHSPFQAHQKDIDRFPKLKGRRKTLAAMIHSMDEAVGQILKALDDKGIADNTFVLFSSDNGGVGGIGDNAPLRGAKLTVFEGGIRVAAAARWPKGGIGAKRVGGESGAAQNAGQNRSKTITQRMGYIDVYPTLMHIATPGNDGKQNSNNTKPLDGINVIEAMRNPDHKLPDRDWFTYMAQSGPTHAAIHSGNLKLIRIPGGTKKKPQGEKTLLFNLAKDPHEQNDISAKHSDKVKTLSQKLDQFLKLKIDGAPVYGEGRQGFKAPKDWKIAE